MLLTNLMLQLTLSTMPRSPELSISLTTSAAFSDTLTQDAISLMKTGVVAIIDVLINAKH